MLFSRKDSQGHNQNTENDSQVNQQIQPAIVKDNIKTPTTNLSVLRSGVNVKAKIEGGGSLIIGGEFDGDIKIEDTLFIEKGAKFSGTVNAKNVKISGEFSGTIYANATEITQSGSFGGNINTNKAFLGGKIDGIVRSIDSIEISKSGVVDTRECKSKQIKIEGKVKGRVIASELLEVTNSGSIEGEIITKGIRTEQGGTIIGNIQTYDKHLHEDDNLLDSIDNESNEQEDEISKLININPDDIQKYARKDNEGKTIKRIPADKK